MSDQSDTAGETARRWRMTPYAAGLVAAFTLYPFASFLNRNRTELAGAGQVLLYAVVAVVVMLAVLAAVIAVWRGVPADRLAVAVAAFVVAFTSFHVFFSADPTDDRRVPQLLLWALLTVLFVVLAYRFSSFAQVRFFVLVLAVLVTALPLGEYLIWRVGSEGGTSSAAGTSGADDGAPAPPTDVEAKPNVYLIVLDEYARVDQMDEVLGFDNRPFYDELEDRGFVTVDDLHAPFQQTIMSMASLLDMDYVATEPDDAPDGYLPFADRLRGENATVAWFDALGYDYVYAEPGLFDWNRCVGEVVDLCIGAQSTGFNLDELELSLLQLTPIGSLDIVRERISDPAYVMEQFGERREEVDEPFFLYAHVLSPHHPYRWEADCELRSRFAYAQYPLEKSEKDAANYVQDVGCLNQRVLDAVDVILEEDPDALVIVQSDHGSKFIPDGWKRLEEWSDAALREELGILFAVHAPERCRDDFAALENSVNVFRVVTACIAGRPPDLLDDRVFIWPETGPGPQELDDPTILAPQP